MPRRLSFGEIATIGGLVLAGVVWAVRLEGRIDAQQRELVIMQSVHKDAIAQVRTDLGYIRSRIDAALSQGGR